MNAINGFLRRAYTSKRTGSRYDRMIHARDSFMRKYGEEGLSRYFAGSRKQLWFAIERVIPA